MLPAVLNVRTLPGMHGAPHRRGAADRRLATAVTLRRIGALPPSPSFPASAPLRCDRFSHLLMITELAGSVSPVVAAPASSTAVAARSAVTASVTAARSLRCRGTMHWNGASSALLSRVCISSASMSYARPAEDQDTDPGTPRERDHGTLDRQPPPRTPRPNAHPQRPTPTPSPRRVRKPFQYPPTTQIPRPSRPTTSTPPARHYRHQDHST